MRRRFKASENPNKQRIIDALVERDVYYWQLAQAMGCHEQTILNRMRNPSDEWTEEVLRTIEDFAR